MQGSSVSHDLLRQMCEAMQSPLRPGMISLWSDGPVGFGLLTFGESPGAFQAINGVVTVADARLDTRGSIGQSDPNPEIADATVIAGLPMQNAAADLHGDYAVGQWNTALQILTLTRDALGIRPVCYSYQAGSHVVFASFPAGIFASGLLQRVLNREQLVRELRGAPAAESTLFEGVWNVRPGHTIAFSPAGELAQCYWQPKPRAPLMGTRQDAAFQLRHLLQDAVNACLGTAGPVAAHLSGGLDSSALCVLASRNLQRSGRYLLGYSFLSEAWPGLKIEGERPFVEAVLQQEPAILWQEVQAVFSPEWLHDRWNADTPLVLSDGSPENVVCADASDRGAAVVLSGWGGDEGITFNGRGAFAASFRRGRWAQLGRELRSMRRERGFQLRNMLLGDVLGPLLPPNVTNRVRRLAGRAHKNGLTMADFLAPDLQALASDAGPVETEADPARVQAKLLGDGHLSFRAARFAAIGARYGMAFRFPLLNRRVVEFALSMPPAWHIHAGWKRRLFREAMEGVLPPLVQWRHSKFRSLPKVPFQFTQERDRVLQRVEQLAANPLIAALFRMEQVAEVLRMLPSPETVTDPGTDPALAALPYLAQLLDYAFFLEQHFPA